MGVQPGARWINLKGAAGRTRSMVPPVGASQRNTRRADPVDDHRQNMQINAFAGAPLAGLLGSQPERARTVT